MARGRPVRGHAYNKQDKNRFAELENLGCYKKYGFGNGYFRDEDEREKKDMLPSPCAKCPKNAKCYKKTEQAANPSDPKEMLVVLGLNEIEGTTARVMSDIRADVEELPPVAGMRDMQEFYKISPCKGKYGFGTGYWFSDEVPICGICGLQKSCYAEFQKQLIEGIPLIENYVKNMLDGAQARNDGEVFTKETS